MNKPLSAGEIVKDAWARMRSNLGSLIVIILVYLIVNAVLGFLSVRLEGIGSVILGIVEIAVGIIMSMGLLNISLKLANGESVNVGELFQTVTPFFSFLFASILYALIVIAGTILLVFPGVIWTLKFYLYPYYVIDQGMGPVAALKASAAATGGAKWDMLGVIYVLNVVVFLGFFALVIGLVATIPTAAIAYALMYKKLASTSAEPSAA